MLTQVQVQSKFKKIQKQLFYMIPEKWNRVYLYASAIDHFKEVQTGEMFFYYFPQGILKKNPVNVYEVPGKFNIDEQDYLKLAQKLYDEIKLLRKEWIESGEKPWTSITISVEEFKFNVTYGYEDLQHSEYNSYDRHLIWRHQYLGVPLSSYPKHERRMIEEYLTKSKHKINNHLNYQEGIYKKPVSNIIQYNKLGEKPQEAEEKTKAKTDFKLVLPKQLNQKNKEMVDEIEEPTIKSQILTMNMS